MTAMNYQGNEMNDNQKAASILRQYAGELYQGHTIGGEWDGEHIKAEHDELIALADRLALAQSGEVAWQLRLPNGSWSQPTANEVTAEVARENKVEVRPLYARPAPAVQVPGGMALVPVEPTPRMIGAGIEAYDGRCESAYRAMLAAAPSAPAVPPGHALVPVEPTQEMLAAVSWPGCARTDYAHMLAAAPSAPVAREHDDDIKQMMKFYAVYDLVSLARIQSEHVARLQKKLPPMRDEQPRNPRAGGE